MAPGRMLVGQPQLACRALRRRLLLRRSSGLGTLARQSRLLHTGAGQASRLNGEGTREDKLAQYGKYFNFPPSSSKDDFKAGREVTVHGFLGKRRDMSSKATFVDVSPPGLGAPVQIRSAWDVEDSPEHLAHLRLRSVPPYSAVAVTGTVVGEDPEGSTSSEKAASSSPLVLLRSVQVLNPFPKDIIVSKGAVFPPSARHLQMRFSKSLQRRLAFRSYVAESARKLLSEGSFQEVETPVLFKSTPEGAREFLVPTRRRGFAYALPQSPQQFKQILMASGVSKYFQFARCFRDEDLRADRQPEFTQLDLEMSFATGRDVMTAVEHLVKSLYAKIQADFELVRDDGEFVPVQQTPNGKQGSTRYPDLPPFLQMTYQEAMSLYGSDKPDLRIPSVIRRIDHLVPSDFVGMITDLKGPIVDACRFRLDGAPKEIRDFVRTFWDGLPASLAKNPDGAPAVMIYDSSKPLGSLAPLGHEAVAQLTSDDATTGLEGLAPFEDGDILVVQARPNKPFEGGSTALGSLRTELYREAVEQELLPRDDRFLFLWVVGFPMFTPDNEVDRGQGGKAGFSATHHPFTAPLTQKDFELLATSPLEARADHYDLVVNGVELGGGSRRIHVAEVQEFVMRDILQMDDKGVAQFAHLLQALRAGCPPHAGFALGFDRLTALLSGTGSVRDVIAFPKSMKGEDLSVKSPSRLTKEQLETYHLALRKNEPSSQA